MREALFLKQNVERWKTYERPVSDPDLMAERFVALTDDLAYAKTFYPGSKTVKYLNNLAADIHLAIYKNRKEKKNRFLEFWKTDLPLVLARNRKALLYAFLFFMTFVLMGVMSAKYDASFRRLILGDGYVNMTNENIEKGDPFGVYKSMDPGYMFVRIALNNIYVSFMVFVQGFFLGIGTVYGLFRNGVMLGAFEYYFFKQGLGMQSILVVFIHGTLEISAIVIAGAAGIILGNSILFPGTYSRGHSMRSGAMDGIKIMVGLVPVFIVAAFFEGYVTRHTGMPLWLSVSILSLSAAFIIWYFVIYPYIVLKKYNEYNLAAQTDQGLWREGN
ncbi:MAG: stage II sporulation protein M [Sphingobacteriales bacterium]